MFCFHTVRVSRVDSESAKASNPEPVAHILNEGKRAGYELGNELHVVVYIDTPIPIPAPPDEILEAFLRNIWELHG
jgi:hypothetical protein